MVNFEFDTATENPFFEGVFDIAPNEVWEKKSQLQLIDVRQPEEFTGELGHIPGSQLIVMNTIPDHLHLLDKEKPIVFVCRSGNRSAQVTAYLLQNGFKNVFNLRGGMIFWNQLLLPKE